MRNGNYGLGLVRVSVMGLWETELPMRNGNYGLGLGFRVYGKQNYEKWKLWERVRVRVNGKQNYL